MRETWLLLHHHRVPDRKTDRKQLTVWEMTESKGEKAKCQSGKTKIDHRESANRGVLSSGGEGEREKRERHYRQIIVISACVCALRVRINGRKSICTTNLVHSGNRTDDIFTASTDY